MLDHPLDAETRTAYLARLGVDPEPPSADALARLVRRHAERVPYETLWIQAGQAWGIDPAASAARIAHTTRGGYCYHLNGALGLLLRSLGYEVRPHVGGVQGSPVLDPKARGNHLVLTVTGLPAADHPEGDWYVDVGLGDALHEPLPLRPGTHRQDPWDLGLARRPGGWRLDHDPAGGFHAMDWEDGEAGRSDFEERHLWLSTAPESGFVKVAMAERRDATGVDVLRGLVRLRVGEGARTDEPVTSRAEWFDLVAEVVGVQLEDATDDQRDRLWETVLSAHRSWSESDGGA